MEAGDYVRTNDGYINKIKKVNQWNVLVDARDLFGEEINIANNEIVKSSPSIIDLIEVGDYVNGCPVLHKENNVLICGLLLWYKEENIENVVTKEQFESIKYDLGE